MARPVVRKSARLLALATVALSRPWAPSFVAAQIPSADAGSLGLGGPSPTLSRGYAAIAGNPAALGVQDAPAWSGTALSVAIRHGLDPIGMGELARWEDRDTPRSVRLGWLDDVRRSGSEAGAAGLDLTLLAVSRGSVGVQLSTRAAGDVQLNRDAVELLLFGNAGFTGEPHDFELSGSRGEGFAVTTLAVAYGRRAGRLAGGDLHLGATASLWVGHALAIARDNGSGLSGDPTELDLRFPLLHSAGGGGLDVGRGIGLDLGALWIRGPLTLGATVRNALNTFEWTLDDLVLRPGTAFFDPDRSTTDFDERPAREAPPVLLDALSAMTVPPVLAAGASYRSRPNLTLSADLSVGPGGGMAVDPDARLGVGAEYVPREGLPLRGGLALLERGVELSAGASLVRGRFVVAGGTAFRVGALDDVILGALNVSFLTR